ncbi:unnamed protein product [Toxocara canis]|uniref:Uncharacterized protein n=1 Tax=Toxocara canis TaxID=6265 RepID=A0A3P7G987_TOXCA|nr:unnamed protein product [Toxocara canis]
MTRILIRKSRCLLARMAKRCSYNTLSCRRRRKSKSSFCKGKKRNFMKNSSPVLLI